MSVVQSCIKHLQLRKEIGEAVLGTTPEPITFAEHPPFRGFRTRVELSLKGSFSPRLAAWAEAVVCCVAGGRSAAASAAAPAATADPAPDLGPCLGLSPDLIPDRRLPQSPTPLLGPGSPGTALSLRQLCWSSMGWMRTPCNCLGSRSESSLSFGCQRL